MSSWPHCGSINPPGAGAAPPESAVAGGCGCRLCRGGSCNPSPPSAPLPSPSESWERFWFLGSWTTSCQEHKWQLAFGACWVGKGNRYGRVRVRPWRGAGPPAQRVPASCSSSPGWANCFHGRVWVTWESAQGAARSGCPHCPQTSGCGWGGGARIRHRGAPCGGCEPCREVPALVNLSQVAPPGAVRWVVGLAQPAAISLDR